MIRFPRYIPRTVLVSTSGNLISWCDIQFASPSTGYGRVRIDPRYLTDEECQALAHSASADSVADVCGFLRGWQMAPAGGAMTAVKPFLVSN